MPLDMLVPELYSTDIERTRTFYIGDLGFKILFERAEDKFIYMEREKVQIMIEELGVGRNWISGELTYPFGRGVSFQIPCSDVTALYNSLQAKKAKIFLPLEEKWYRRDDLLSGSRQFIVQDPDGFLLRMAQDLGKKPVR